MLVQGHDANRKQKRAYLKEIWLPQWLTQALGVALAAHDTDTHVYSIEMDPTLWKVRTVVPILYAHNGWYQVEEEEEMVYAEVNARITINSNAVGVVQKIKWTADRGFYNLAQCVEEATEDESNNAPPPTGRKRMLMRDLMAQSLEQTNEANENNEFEDYRVEQIVEVLCESGMGKKAATKKAQQAVQSQPECHDIDNLIDLII